MITQNCDIYVVDKGFVNPADLSPGDKVYTLDGFKVEIKPLNSIRSEFVSSRLNRIDAGPHNIVLTDDAELLYYSEIHGFKYIKFNQIPGHTRDKAYWPDKYLPVLSWPESGSRARSNVELEYIARMVLSREYDHGSFKSIIRGCTGSDCLALIDFLEFWCSESPGKGWFDRAQVKARTHVILDKYICEELAKVAVLAGFTAGIDKFDVRTFALRVNYESMPIPGSRPKNEKYYHEYYTGLVYDINAGNLSILGRSRDRIFYLPTRNGTIEAR